METPDNKSHFAKTLLELHREETVRNIPLLAYLIILCFSGISGNSLVFYTFKMKYSISTFRMFVLFLSAVDLFACTLAIPLEMVTLLLEYKNDNDWLCKMYSFFFTWPTITSTFLLVAIAVDRYRKVCTPFSWQVSCRTARNIFIFFTLMSFGCTLLTPVIFGSRPTKNNVYNMTTFDCEITNAMMQTPFPMINISIFAIIFLGSLTGISIMYCCIAVRVKQRIHWKHELTGKFLNDGTAVNRAARSDATNVPHVNSQGLENETSQCIIALNSCPTNKDREDIPEAFERDTNYRRKQLSRRNRPTLVMFMVSLAFFVSFLPSLSIYLIRILEKDFVESLSDFERSVYKFCFRSYLLNCVINPVIYGIFDPHFRKSCKWIFLCRRNHQRR